MGIDVPQSNVSRLKQFYGGHFLCPSGLWHRQATPSLVHLLCSLPSSSCHLNSLFVGMPLWGPQCDWAMLLHLNNQLLDGEICKECKETQNVWLSTGNTPKYEWNLDGYSLFLWISFRKYCQVKRFELSFWVYFSIPEQCGGEPLHCPSSWHILVVLPMMLRWPMQL